MCPHIYDSIHYICVLIFTTAYTIYVSSYLRQHTPRSRHGIRYAILLYMRPSSPHAPDIYMYMCIFVINLCPHTSYMCPPNHIYVSSYYICRISHPTIWVSSYREFLMLLYMCPHTLRNTPTYVFSHCGLLAGSTLIYVMCERVVVYNIYSCICVLIYIYIYIYCIYTYIYIYIYIYRYIYIYLHAHAYMCPSTAHTLIHLMCWRMLTYADVCWRMLTYADVCWRMLTYADVC
jgi:hypothetical protein